MNKELCVAVIAFVAAIAGPVYAGDYNISRQPDGPFSFKISGVDINEGSSMQRESVLFNEASCPVQIVSHTSSFIYKDRGFRISGKTELIAQQPITAIQVRTALYDVFGKHMQNLANTEPKDFSTGPATISGEWRARDNDAAELLTTVTYVARVRLADGTQWVCNFDDLQLALSSLNLEKKIGEE